MGDLETLKRLLSSLQRDIANAKKSAGRGYKRDTVLSKLQNLEQIKAQASSIIQNTTDSKTLSLSTSFKQAYNTFKELLEIQLIESNMSDFDITTAVKVIPTFDGKYKDLHTFTKLLEFLNETLNEPGKKQLLDFVINVKLTDTARLAVGTNVPTNMASFVKLLKQKFVSSNTIQSIQTTLNSVSQNKSSVTNYRDKILHLTSELSHLQVAELGETVTEAEKNLITKLNGRQALTTFLTGLNPEIRDTVFSSRPKDMTEAANYALELEKRDSGNRASVFQVNSSGRNFQNRNTNRGNFHSSNNSFNNRIDYRPNNSYRSNNYNQQPWRNRDQSFSARNNSNTQSRPNNRGRNRGNFNQNRNNPRDNRNNYRVNIIQNQGNGTPSGEEQD